MLRKYINENVLIFMMTKATTATKTTATEPIAVNINASASSKRFRCYQPGPQNKLSNDIFRNRCCSACTRRMYSIKHRVVLSAHNFTAYRRTKSIYQMILLAFMTVRATLFAIFLINEFRQDFTGPYGTIWANWKAHECKSQWWFYQSSACI